MLKRVRICSLSFSRDITDKTVGTLSQRITAQLHALHGLQTHLEGIRDYLGKVAAGKLPINHTILYQLQDILNLLPNLNLEDFTKAFAVKMNDQLLVVYLASLIRAVIALHNLIGNKVTNREAEAKEREGEKAKKDGEKAKKEGKKEGEGKDRKKEDGGSKKDSGSTKDTAKPKPAK